MADVSESQPHFCSVCEQGVLAFREYGIPPRTGECPHCGAKSRHRDAFALVEMLTNNATRRRILELGPSRVTTRYLPPRLASTCSYTAIDIRPLRHHQRIRPPHSFEIMDGTAMRFADASFDLVIANCVLNFVPAAGKMLAEIRRVLSPAGVAVLNSERIPEPTTRSGAEYQRTHPELSRDYIEMNGPSWFFGDDYPELLAAAGLVSLQANFTAAIPEAQRWREGLKEYSELVLAARTREALDWGWGKVQGRSRLLHDLRYRNRKPNRFRY